MAGAYPLAAMLRVRGLHEDRVRREARAAEERLREAQNMRDEREAELLRYRAWRPEEEDRRYAAVMGKSLNVEALGAFRDSLAELTIGEVEREQKVREADDDVQKRKREADAAQAAVVLARRACMKLEKHRDIWIIAMHREEERLSDLAMEESRGPAKSSDES